MLIREYPDMSYETMLVNIPTPADSSDLYANYTSTFFVSLWLTNYIPFTSTFLTHLTTYRF